MLNGAQIDSLVDYGATALVYLTLVASGLLFWHAGLKDKRGRRS